MQAYVGRGPSDAFTVIQVEKPKLAFPTDVIVKVHAAATNPVDAKSVHFAKENHDARALGFDASGVIVEVGAEVKGFKVGDQVYYAGDVFRAGSFAEFQAVDSRIIALKPTKLDHTQSAAFPLVALTAYEALHENIRIQAGKTLFILNGAGGVGSVAIQLGKLAGLTVIASASRPESVEFVKKLGADYVVDHTKSLEEQWKTLGLPLANYVMNAHATSAIPSLIPIMATRGHICSITADTDINTASQFGFMFKRLTLSWELMFSRAKLAYEQEEQGKILAIVAKYIDSGLIKPIDQVQLKGFAEMDKAQEIQKSGKAVGKSVITWV